MSSVFDMKRFARLWRAHWAEYLKAYIWFFIVCIIVYFVMALLALSTAGYRGFDFGAQVFCFYGGLFVTGAIFSARYFEGLARKESALLMLMRPASIFEKTLLAIIVVSVCFPIAYSIVYSVCNYPMVKIAQALKDADLITRKVEIDSLQERIQLFFPFISIDTFSVGSKTNFRLVQLMLCLGLWTVQAFCVAASIYFKRIPLLKIVLAGFILTIIYSLFMVMVGRSFPNDLWGYWVDSEVEHTWARTFGAALFWFGTPILLWLTAYFYLKEREVA